MSKIEWTDRSDWNPLRGCTRASEGCRHCYAEAIAARFSGPGQPFEGYAEKTPNGPRWTGKIELIEDRLTLPLKWRKPAKIFVNSASDLFHEAVPDEWIDRVFAVMALAPQHTFQILTKRPKRMREYVEKRLKTGLALGAGTAALSYVAHPLSAAAFLIRDGFLPNVWLGVTAEDQTRADERIPELLATPAAKRFVSVEPMLGPVDLRNIAPRDRYEVDALIGFDFDQGTACDRLHWVICGGESGPGARPMHPSWARSLRDQCKAAGVPFFFKQWGEWRPPLDGEEYSTAAGRAQRVPAFIVAPSGTVHCFENEETANGGSAMLRVGKKAAGDRLDGVEHKEFPQ